VSFAREQLARALDEPAMRDHYTPEHFRWLPVPALESLPPVASSRSVIPLECPRKQLYSVLGAQRESEVCNSFVLRFTDPFDRWSM